MAADWDGIAEIVARGRASQPPAEQASWDQLMATLEHDAAEKGVDLNDPAQARAAMLGASTALQALQALPLWPLFGAPFFEVRGQIVVALFGSFITKEPAR